MRHYSDFWLSGAVLSPAWADRPDLPEQLAPEDAANPLESLAMADWLRLPDAVQQAVVAHYTGIERERPSGQRRAMGS